MCGIRGEQIHQSIRVPIRQRSQKNRIHQAEDGSACADAQSQRTYRGDGKTRAAAQRAQAILSVLPKGIKPWQAAAFPLRLLRLLHAAKVDESLAARFPRTKAGADARVRVERDMGFKLGREVVFGTAAAEQAQ